MNLIQRQIDIINHLHTFSEWHTGKDLSAIFCVSIRTIRNDISIINKEYQLELIKSSKSYGYMLEVSTYDKILMPQTMNLVEERIPKILLHFILKYQNTTDLFELANHFYISEYTLLLDFKEVRQIFIEQSKYQILLEKNRNLIQMRGALQNSAKLLLTYFKHHGYQRNFIDYDDSFQFVSLPKVKYLLEIHTYTPLFTRHLTFEDALLLTSVFAEQSFQIETDLSDFEWLEKGNINEVQNSEMEVFIQAIIEEFQLTNQNFFRHAVLSTIIPLLQLEEKEQYLKNSTTSDDPLYPVLIQILNDVKDIYAFDITNHEKLIIDFLIHIKTAILRMEEDVDSSNPLLEYIRLNYTFLFDIAFYIANQLSKKLERDFSKEEISFFVIYLISPLKMMKENILLQYNVELLLYVIEGPSIMHNIVELIKQSIENKRIKISTASSSIEFKEKKLHHYDILVTTSTHLVVGDLTTCVIHPFLSVTDIKHLNNAVNQIFRQKKDLHFNQLFDFFFHKQTFLNYEEPILQDHLIKKMCNQLTHNNFVNDAFYYQVVERENLISTAFDTGIALPHTITNSAFKSNISFARLNQPIKWGAQKVRCVFLFAIAKEDLNILNLIYKIIISICSSDIYASMLYKCKTYDELKSLLYLVYNEL